MDEQAIVLELLGFAEKIALARLEASKAEERVRELEYARSRFEMEARKPRRDA